MDLTVNFRNVIPTSPFISISNDAEEKIFRDILHSVLRDRVGFNFRYFFNLITLHIQSTISAHGFITIRFHALALGPFGVNYKQFRSLFIFKTNLVEISGLPFWSATSLDTTLGLIFRQFIWIWISRVVDGSDHDWLVGITFNEVDQDFVTNTRNKLKAPSGTRPVLSNPDPESETIALAIPMKMNLNTTKFIGVDLAPIRTCDGSCLRTLHHWTKRRAQGTERRGKFSTG